MKLDRLASEQVEEYLEAALDSPSGILEIATFEGIGSKFFANKLRSIIRRTAVESFELYDEGHPLYGKGAYSQLEVVEDGANLYIVNSEEKTPKDPVLLMIAVAARQVAITVELPSREEAKSYQAYVTRAKRSLWRAVQTVTPKMEVVHALEGISIRSEGNFVRVLPYHFRAKPIPVTNPDTIAAIRELAIARKTFKQSLDES
jgi:hypothetical protein